MKPYVILGGWQLSAGHQRTPRSREELLTDLLVLVESGVTTFDCADIYTGVEDLFGDLRRSCEDRLGLEVATSLRFHTKLVPDRSTLAAVDRADVERIVRRSISRLGVERLDLVQFAWWDYDVPGYVETALWLDELRREGLLASIGVTNFDVPRLREILEAGVPIEANQVQYSALDRRPESGMVELSVERGIELFCYGTLAGGFLSDRYVGAPDPGIHVANRSLTKYRLIIDEFGGWEAFQELLRILRATGERIDASVAQVALAYVFSRPGVSAAIVGMSRPERIIEAVSAMDLTLPSDQLEHIRRLALETPGPSGDCFSLEREKDGPHASVMKYDLNRGATARRPANPNARMPP